MTKGRLVVEAVNRMLYLHFAVHLFFESLTYETKLAADRMEEALENVKNN